MVFFGVRAAGQEASASDTEAGAVEEGMSKIVTVDFRDTPIDDVLRSLADQSKVNIVKSPKITGNVTASISGVSLREALDNILAVQDCGYVTTKNTIRIVPRDEIALEETRLVSKVYRITYADATAVALALKDFLSESGGLMVSPGSSNVMVTDTEAKMRAIDEFIKDVDRITPQILVEAKIYDISSTDQLDLGIDWSAGRSVQLDPGTGLIVGGRTEPFLGSAFSSSIARTTKTDNGFLEFGYLNEHINIDAVLSAKQDEICAKLLANPRILVLDNEQATIKIVSELPFQELTQTSGGGNIGTTSFREVGVELEVTPHIARDGMIRLKLRPSFSVQVDSVSIAMPTQTGTISFPQPVIDTREATTTALIRDGEVVVIGGLRKKDTIMETSKVPLLGDIPLLGALFRFEGEKTVNSELVVFIRPRIVIEPTLTSKEEYFLSESERELSTPGCPTPKVDRCYPKEDAAGAEVP